MTTDDLTGLANRERFREVMEERIVAARQAGGAFAVMLMDLDRFKEINDTLGHHYGDVLLRDLGPRLVDATGLAGAGRAPRRRRVRRTAATGRARSDADRANRDPAHALRQCSVRRRRAVARGRGQHRHRSFPRGRRGLARAAAVCGHRDVRGQRGPVRLQGLRGQPESALGPTPERAQRHPPRAQLRRDRRPLPADRRTRRAHGHAAPRAWSAGSIPSSA